MTELLGVKINSPDELKLGVMDFQNRVPKTVIKKLRLPLDPKVSEKISEYLVSISGAIKAVQYAITVFRGKSGKIRTRHIDIIREMIISIQIFLKIFMNILLNGFLKTGMKKLMIEV